MSQQPVSNIVELARMRRQAQKNAQAEPRAKILFVDDEERILNNMRALFRMHYEVMIATDGYHALELLRREQFHLIVSDQRMPNMQGVELLRQAKEISPHTVRILLTGFADLAAIVGSVNEGEVYRYINKPWDNDELQEVISGAVRVGLDLARLPPPNSVALNPVPASSLAEESKPRDTLRLPTPAAAVSSAAEGMKVLFVDHDAQLLGTFEQCPQIGCRPLNARTPAEALELMQQHEVAVIVASIDGQDRDNIEFLQLLKKEHPHVVSLAVASTGDGDTIIGLLNSARVYRVIFRPIRLSVLRHYLESALKQAERFRNQPELLKVQQPKAPPPNAAPSGLGAMLSAKLNSIRSFFTRRS